MSEQEDFWRGEFGTEYNLRNDGEPLIANNMKFWRRVFNNFCSPLVIEFGAGTGMNLIALSRLGVPQDRMTAVEINHSACEKLRRIEGVKVLECSMLEGAQTGEFGSEVSSFGQHDMVISSGLLIHIGPDELEAAYDVLHRACAPGGTIVLIEYFAPTETPVIYRGNEGKLWRRNYGRDMLTRFPDLGLLCYDFVADIDPECPRDNVTVWCLKKK